MSRALKAALVGLAVAAIGIAAAAIPSISALEDSLALRWLFLARGRVAPPPQASPSSASMRRHPSFGLARASPGLAAVHSWRACRSSSRARRIGNRVRRGILP